ncbi:hypothetical protein PROFUN_05160 [Planoprotostelium fungivorum]|uniref:PIH1D1/2/3 CS-like domain-containing protein n=1 Tax=Planoprotostelium fungivorum TaxID=1890364 RepID=A0A2P6NRV6_9EUKA|nr:hypothetical protein PROFUN_05160 [Planoprotostelium fungivorum]
MWNPADVEALGKLLEECDKAQQSTDQEADDAAERNKPKLPEAQEGDIWAPDEIPDIDEARYDLELDSRTRPSHTLSFKQHVSAEDAFFGIGGNTPGILSCEEMTLRVNLPGVRNITDIALEVTDDLVDLRSSAYKLIFPLPQPVFGSKARAKWIRDASCLEIALPLQRQKLELL